MPDIRCDWWAVAFNEQWSKGESYLWRYVTRLLRIMKARPSLLAIARYRDAWDHAADRTPHGSPIELTPEDFRPPA